MRLCGPDVAPGPQVAPPLGYADSKMVIGPLRTTDVLRQQPRGQRQLSLLSDHHTQTHTHNSYG